MGTGSHRGLATSSGQKPRLAASVPPGPLSLRLASLLFYVCSLMSVMHARRTEAAAMLVSHSSPLCKPHERARTGCLGCMQATATRAIHEQVKQVCRCCARLAHASAQLAQLAHLIDQLQAARITAGACVCLYHRQPRPNSASRGRLTGRLSHVNTCSSTSLRRRPSTPDGPSP